MLPPGPRTPPLLQIARWIRSPLAMLDACHRDYGDAFTLHGMNNRDFVVVSTPELIRKVFAADPDTLLAGKSNETLLEPMLGSHSLLTLDGREHLRQRRLLLPAFHGDRMQAF